MQITRNVTLEKDLGVAEADLSSYKDNLKSFHEQIKELRRIKLDANETKLRYEKAMGQISQVLGEYR